MNYCTLCHNYSGENAAWKAKSHDNTSGNVGGHNHKLDCEGRDHTYTHCIGTRDQGYKQDLDRLGLTS